MSKSSTEYVVNQCLWRAFIRSSLHLIIVYKTRSPTPETTIFHANVFILKRIIYNEILRYYNFKSFKSYTRLFVSSPDTYWKSTRPQPRHKTCNSHSIAFVVRSITIRKISPTSLNKRIRIIQHSHIFGENIV